MKQGMWIHSQLTALRSLICSLWSIDTRVHISYREIINHFVSVQVRLRYGSTADSTVKYFRENERAYGKQRLIRFSTFIKNQAMFPLKTTTQQQKLLTRPGDGQNISRTCAPFCFCVFFVTDAHLCLVLVNADDVLCDVEVRRLVALVQDNEEQVETAHDGGAYLLRHEK